MDLPTTGTDSVNPRALAVRFIAGRLRELLEQLEAAAARLERPDRDDEAVHDVRVTTRRLRGGLAAIRPVLNRGGRVRKLNRRLRDLRRRLGEARELEVGLALLGQLQSRVDPVERPALAALQILVAGGSDAPAVAGGGVADSGLAGSLKVARSVVLRLEQGRGFRWPTAADPAGPGTELPALALSSMAERYGAVMALPRWPLTAMDDAAQHRFRIEAKKLRYTMEFFAPLFSRRLGARVALLKAIQDLLGELHDLADMVRLAETTRSRCRAAGAPELDEGLKRLIDRLEARRRLEFAGFAALDERLSHPGFLPREMPRSEAGPAPAASGEPPEELVGEPVAQLPPAAPPGADPSPGAGPPPDAGPLPDTEPPPDAPGDPPRLSLVDLPADRRKI